CVSPQPSEGSGGNGTPRPDGRSGTAQLAHGSKEAGQSLYGAGGRMCGIAGIVAPDGFDPQTLVTMTQLIHYRGPDGFGFALSSLKESPTVDIVHNQLPRALQSRPFVGLGNRRLAILDVSTAGNQPMQTADGALAITYNGEIYNYKELREELKQLGHSFRTETDTEVVLHAYQQWGEDCLHRFNGMWAFALLDLRRRTLFCSRDRFGVKPFYYALHGQNFYFASEIKQILSVSGIPRLANPSTVTHFLEWGLVDHSSQTFFTEISQLPGGHSLTLELSSSLSIRIERYWDLPTEPQLDLADQAAEQQFTFLFEDAVKLRLRSNVPVGISLTRRLNSSA